MLRPPPRAWTSTGALALITGLYSLPASAQERPELPSRAARPAPEPDLPAPSTRLNLALTGVGVTAAWYGAAVGSSLIWHNGPWAPDMRLPIVGPWMAMPHFGCGPAEPNCGAALIVVRGILAGLDGVGQVGGLAVALESLFLPVRKSERARPTHGTKHAWVRPVPLIAGRDTIGLVLVGEL